MKVQDRNLQVQQKSSMILGTFSEKVFLLKYFI